MKHLTAVLLVGAPSALFLACAGGEITTTGSSGSGGNAACVACLSDKDCASGSQCGQFAGDAYCAPDCSSSSPCASDRACTTLTTAEGQQAELCIPKTNVCGGSGAGGASATSSSQASSTSASSSSSTTSSSSTSSSSGSTGGGSVGANGGTVDLLRFAIVGDTRPPTEDDTSGYPTAVITKIWQDVEAHSPKPYFAVSTGDYQYAKPTGGTSAAQLTTYLDARAAFTNVVFPAMGNHECTGGTATNCGPGGTYSTTNNFSTFMSKMLAPLGKSEPYYSINVNGANNAWTAKFVIVACNYWSSTQATWLDTELAKPTTYTFVVRHMGSDATTAPCLSGSSNNAAQIMGSHPLTLLIAGHTHTFAYYPSEKQIIVGNGGAPLSGAINYGYVVAEAQSPGGPLTVKEYDYSTNASQQTYTVNP